MSQSAHLARHLREVYFGGNWTAVNLRDQLEGVNREKAIATWPGLKPIATLVFHIHYYTAAILRVAKGGPLEAKDALSFDVPPIESEEQWQEILTRMWREAEELAELVAQIPDDQWDSSFTEEKYGSWYRNLAGLTEHTHYHLGQVVWMKKLLEKEGRNQV